MDDERLKHLARTIEQLTVDERQRLIKLLKKLPPADYSGIGALRKTPPRSGSGAAEAKPEETKNKLIEAISKQ